MKSPNIVQSTHYLLITSLTSIWLSPQTCTTGFAFNPSPVRNTGKPNNETTELKSNEDALLARTPERDPKGISFGEWMDSQPKHLSATKPESLFTVQGAGLVTPFQSNLIDSSRPYNSQSYSSKSSSSTSIYDSWEIPRSSPTPSVRKESLGIQEDWEVPRTDDVVKPHDIDTIEIEDALPSSSSSSEVTSTSSIQEESSEEHWMDDVVKPHYKDTVETKNESPPSSKVISSSSIQVPDESKSINWMKNDVTTSYVSNPLIQDPPSSEVLSTYSNEVPEPSDTMNWMKNDVKKDVFIRDPQVNKDFEKVVLGHFPGAVTNQEIVSRVSMILGQKGYTPAKTLLATSLCCDELARQLEKDFTGVYGKNFNLGGLSGFPFAGNTGFGAMAAHIPDDGYCLLVHGPHVGITEDGEVGKVERSGIALVDKCCGSAIAASNYLQGITDGGAIVTTRMQTFTDFQQRAVQQLILPWGKRLSSATNRMVELPLALYESQDLLVTDIVQEGSLGIKKGLALLGGIQINTGPKTPDYFIPMRFDIISNGGEVIADLLPELKNGNPPRKESSPSE